jgi:6-phosphofructokinase 1
MEGISGEMASIIRTNSNPYTVVYSSLPVGEVANHEKKIPSYLISENGNDVTKEMLQYLIPLVQGEVNTLYENGIPKHMVF